MAAKKGSAAGGRKAAARGGIGAKGGKRQPTGTGRGRSIGGGAASGATGGSARKNAFGVAKGSSAAMHEPAHTFASSTMPRRKKTSTAPNPMAYADAKPTKANPDPDHDGDNDLTAKGDTDHDYVLPNGQPGPKATKKAADTATKPMIRPSRKGAFTAKAKAAGQSVQGYAASVLANPQSHDPATVKQANFARNFGGAAKKGGSK